MGELRQRSRLPIHFEADNITFGIYSKEEVLKLSAVEVFNPSCFNMLGHPSENGLYDLRMGAFTDRDHQVCATCHLTIDYCSGHIGHIRLPIPVINPMYYHAVQQLLKIACIHCHTLKMRDLHKIMFKAQMQFLACGLISQAGEVREMTMACDDKDANSPDNIQAYVDEQLSKNKDIVKHSVAETIDNRMLYSLKKSYTKEILKLGKSTKCRGCGATFKSVIKSSAGFIYTGSGGNGDDDLEEALLDSSLTRGRGRRGKGKAESKHEINASELMKLFRKLYSNEKDVLDLLFPALQNEGIEHPTDMFFIENLSLPPSKSRPPQFLGGIVSLHPQTTSLVEVLNAVILMRPLLQVIQGTDIENLSPETQEMIKTMPGDTNVLKLANLWKELQCAVDNVLDANMNKKNTVVTTWGLKQLIERKEGMFRMNMMGKRVNHAARTVITPDPNVMIDEIGVPEVFAKKLSYPVPVTPFNAMELRDLILNGPEKHPGANMIEDEFGRVTSLEQKDYSQRVMLANTLLVPTYRYI
jgi:DNA-directed RNA polymerase I subunit RPA1